MMMSPERPKKGGGLPDGWEKLQPVLVYQLPPIGSETNLKKQAGQLQGVWKQPMSSVQNPVELWIFQQEDTPETLLHPPEGDHPYGSWGYKPGVKPGKCDNVEDMWFFPPNAKKLPKHFTPRGTWSFPVQKRDLSGLVPDQAGFLHVGRAEKREQLDVAGDWRLLYLKDGDKMGPGMEKPKPPMKIHVETPDGKVVTLTVEPEDTIDSVKNQVQDIEGIPKDEQRLRFNKKPLDDRDTLNDCGIEDGDTLKLEPMEIVVKDHKGNKYLLQVNPTDKVSQVKNQLEKQEGIPKENQRLTFRGDPLKDNRNLRDQNVKHQSVLHLEPMQIHVRTPQGDKITLQVEPEDSIRRVKQMIDDELDIPLQDQRLRFGEMELDDDAPTLDGCGIRHNDTLDLEPMQIIIKDWNGKKFPLHVEPDEIIDSIKDKIEKKEGHAKDVQYLIFGGNFLDDPKTLRDYGIKHKDVVNLDRMKIYVKGWKGKTFTLDVDPAENIEDVKKMIKDREGLPVDQQVLKFDKEPLENPKTLKDYNIGYKDTVDLSKEAPPEPITPKLSKPKEVVKSPSPVTPTYTIQLSPWASPFEVSKSPKKKIEREGIRATTKEQCKTRWHTDLASEIHEMGIRADMEREASKSPNKGKNP